MGKNICQRNFICLESIDTKDEKIGTIELELYKWEKYNEDTGDTLDDFSKIKSVECWADTFEVLEQKEKILEKLNDYHKNKESLFGLEYDEVTFINKEKIIEIIKENI